MGIFVPNNPGAVTFTNGSKVITGTGTLFKGFRAGSVITIPNTGSMQLAEDPTSDTSALGVTEWYGANTGPRFYHYEPRNDEAVFMEKVTQLVNQLAGGNIQALAGLTLAANKLIKPTGAGTLGLQDFSQWAQSMLALGGGAANKMPYLSGANAAALADLTAAARQVLDDPDFATMRATMGANDAANLTTGLIGDARLPARLQPTGRAIPSNNYNLAFEDGFYTGTGPTGLNAPPGNASYGPLIVAAATPTSNYIIQIAAFGFAAGPPIIYFRGSNNQGGTWSGWTPMHTEYGSNANGWYSRSPDGTQICWFNYTISLPTANAYAGASGTFPAAFATQTGLLTQATVSNVSGGPTAVMSRLVDTSTTTYNTLASANVAGSSLTFDAMAIGRWFI